MRFLVPAAVCAALLLGVAGCGSSSDSSATTAAATTATTAPASPLPTSTTPKTSKTATADAHKAFLKRVNPICADYNRAAKEAQKRLLATEKQIKGEGNVDPYAGPLKLAAAAAHRASDRFAAVKPPPTEVQEAALISRALQAQAKGNDLLLEAARADDPVQFGVANQALQQVVPNLQSLMRSYGMTVCGARG
jgi:Flp pilus assembly protein TadD